MNSLSEQLVKQGYNCVDMHLHTVHSRDSIIRVKQLLRIAEKQKIGVSITDHNNISGILAAKKLKNRNHFIIPGIEFFCADRSEVLIYFYSMSELEDFHKKHVLPNLNKKVTRSTKIKLSELFDILKNYNCLTSAAHPFYGKGVGKIFYSKNNRGITSPVIKKFNSVEVLNSVLSSRKNRKAMEFAKKFKKPVTAGSDSHVSTLVGEGLTVSEASTVEGFLDSIKKKENFIVGNNVNILFKLKPGVVIVSKYLRTSAFYEKIKDKLFG